MMTAYDIMMTKTVVASKWWMLTSPHRDMTYDDERFLHRLLDSPIVYDWCTTVETEQGADMPHMHVALRMTEAVVPWFGGAQMHLPGWHVEAPVVAGDEAWELMLDYCKKTGEYTHKREYIPHPYHDPNPCWRPWQQYVLDQPRDGREIIVVVDKCGGCGKTYLAGWHDARHKAVLVPPMDSHKDIMRMVYAQHIIRDVYIDIPRALSKRQMRAIYAAAESIKDGKVYDERYQWHCRRYDTPKVVIYTNDEPDRTQLSPDRWIIVYPQRNGTFDVWAHGVLHTDVRR